jgi:hypothetical protein
MDSSFMHVEPQQYVRLCIKMAVYITPGQYDWSVLIILPIVAAIIVGILYTTSIIGSTYYKIAAYGISLIVVGVVLYAIVATSIQATTYPAIPPVANSQDPFSYDPGETANGVVVFAGNGTAIPDQYNCNLKSSNTIYTANQCDCKLGYYGKMCEYEGFDENYVSLTTTTPYSATMLASFTAPLLTTWPITTVTGCTNTCTSNSACLGVTYANKTCTQYSALTFSQAPVQTNIDPPVLDTTLYLNKSRLLGVDFQGYFNIIFGVVPVRYFVGNGLAVATSSSIHITSGGTRIGYYPVGVQSTFAGIPDAIIVGTRGTLYISPTQLPPAGTPIDPRTSFSATTPIILARTNFPYSATNISYWVRLDA